MSTITFGSNNPSLKNAIVGQVQPDLTEIKLNEFHQDFVVVSFCVKDFQVQILDIQGSQKQLIKMISEELSEMYIQREYPDSDIYNYKFIFKKA